jgi:HAD superfamily phosphoserine phosphatase-like hydrolase
MSSLTPSTKKLVIFDLNKTLITSTSWYELNIAMGVTPQEDEVLYRLGPEKEGVLTYHEWIDVLSKIIIKRGKATKQNIENVLLDYTFKDGAKEVVSALKDAGHTVVIVSGAFNMVVDDVAQKLGIKHAYNNAYLVFNKDDYLKEILLTWDDLQYKTLMVNSICKRFGIHPKDAYYVADGDNDENIFAETIGVALHMGQDQHEPWKQSAIEQGEEFSAHKAVKGATFEIHSLNELLNLVNTND